MIGCFSFFFFCFFFASLFFKELVSERVFSCVCVRVCVREYFLFSLPFFFFSLLCHLLEGVSYTSSCSSDFGFSHTTSSAVVWSDNLLSLQNLNLIIEPLFCHCCFKWALLLKHSHYMQLSLMYSGVASAVSYWI